MREREGREREKHQIIYRKKRTNKGKMREIIKRE